MIGKPLDKIADVELRDVLTHIIEEGSGQYLVLTGVPTAASPLLSDGERGIDTSGDIWIRRNGMLYKITPTASLTIT